MPEILELTSKITEIMKSLGSVSVAYLSMQNGVSKLKDWTYPSWGVEKKKEEKLAELKRSVQHHQVYQHTPTGNPRKKEKKEKREERNLKK